MAAGARVAPEHLKLKVESRFRGAPIPDIMVNGDAPMSTGQTNLFEPTQPVSAEAPVPSFPQAVWALTSELSLDVVL